MTIDITVCVCSPWTDQLVADLTTAGLDPQPVDCSSCGARLVISRAGRQHAANEPGGRFICRLCVDQMIREMGEFWIGVSEQVQAERRKLERARAELN